MPNYYELQRQFCKEYDRPVYIPESGICPRCFKNIWTKLTATDAIGKYITACPFCHRSFCE